MKLEKREFPILEFDPDEKAIFNPQNLIKPIDIPEKCVICFFKEVLDHLYNEGKIKLFKKIKSEAGPIFLFEFEYIGERLIAFHPMIGAPMASLLLEKVIAFGVKKFIAVGGAGVLANNISMGQIVVPTTAVRDEGTSYHYLPPGREVEASPIGIKAIEKTLNLHNINYILGKTWTTDAIYRETPEKIKLRKKEGCITVEMEAAAFFAVAKFRNVVFSQIIYGGDDLSLETWDHRGWNKQWSLREKLFWVAAESCINL